MGRYLKIWSRLLNKAEEKIMKRDLLNKGT